MGVRVERREGGREEGLLHHRLLHLHGREERDQRWNPWHGKRREQGAGNQKSFGGVSPLREAAKRKKRRKRRVLVACVNLPREGGCQLL